MDTMGQERFEGAKLALFLGARLLVLERDFRPGIAWPGRLDLPGGGREGAETPEACVLRETREEVGLGLSSDVLVWRRFYEAPVRAWFFAAHLEEARVRDIRFGEEGRGWRLMAPEDFVASELAVPHFRARVAAYLAQAR